MADSSANSGTLEDLVAGFLFQPTTSVSPTTLVFHDNPTMETQVPDTAPDQSRPAEFDNTYSMPNSWFLDTIPPGFKFLPTDEELVQFYLVPKLKNIPLPAHPIPEVNLYGHCPVYFAERYNDHGQQIWYFFTPRERKYPNGNRPNRAAGDGYWKATGADKPIWSTNKDRVGSKKSLAFFKGSPPNGKKTLWLMKEYTVGAPQPANQSMRLDDWVLCAIYKRPEKSNTRARVEETDQPSNYIDLDVLANFDHQLPIGVDHETPTEVEEMNFDEIYYLLNQ